MDKSIVLLNHIIVLSSEIYNDMVSLGLVDNICEYNSIEVDRVQAWLEIPLYSSSLGYRVDDKADIIRYNALGLICRLILDSDLVHFENKYGRVNIDDIIEYCKAFKIDMKYALGLIDAYNSGKMLCELFNVDNIDKAILDEVEISILDVYGLINKGVEIVNICSSKLAELDFSNRIQKISALSVYYRAEHESYNAGRGEIIGYLCK